MVKLEKKQVKIISVLIALVFVGSVVALALTQSGSGLASAASSSVGVVDYNQVLSQSAEYKQAAQTFQQEAEQAQKDAEAQLAKLSNDQEKSDYVNQTRQRMMQREQELRDPVMKNIEAQVKSVAEAKGLQVVLHKEVVVYGGQDITQDVINKMNK